MSSPSLTQGTLPPVRWSALVYGAIVALSLLWLFSAFGGALFFEDAEGFAGRRLLVTRAPVLAALWGLITVPLSAFLGGALAVRLAGSAHPRSAQLQGLGVWGLMTLGAALFRPRAVDPDAGWAASLAMLLALAGAVAGALAARRRMLRAHTFATATPSVRRTPTAATPLETGRPPTPRLPTPRPRVGSAPSGRGGPTDRGGRR